VFDVKVRGDVFVLERREGRISSGRFGSDEEGELVQASLDGGVPRVPERMVVRCRQGRFRSRGAVIISHDAFGEEEVSEEGGDEEVVTEQPSEQVSRQDEPGDRVRHAGKNPVELS
jgi:hypothetical protein